MKYGPRFWKGTLVSRISRIAMLFMFLMCAAVTALADGKITVDPNGPDSPVAESVSDTDTRVAQKVTYEAKRKTVQAILADLTKLTGVKLHAGYSNSDWQVRDRRMNIFAKDIPLSNLMNSVARVMKFKWSVNHEVDPRTYRLYMDRKTLMGVERQRLREEERLSELETQQRTKVLDDLTTASTMSDSDFERIKNDKPGLYVFAKTGWAALMPTLFEQVPEAKSAWLAGEAMTLVASDLPPAAQEAVRKSVEMMGDDLGRTIGPEVMPPADATADLSKIRVLVNRARSMLGYRGDTFIGDMTLEWPGGGNNSSFSDFDSEAIRSIARDYIRILDGGQPVGRGQQNQMNKGHLQAIEQQKTDFGEPELEHPADPTLDKKVKLKTQDEGFEGRLAAIAKASGFATVSDSFKTKAWLLATEDQDAPLKDILQRMTSVCRYNWQRQGQIIEFRHRDWFRKRAAQIPDAWLEKWRKSMKDTGTLDLDQMSEIALLTDEQIRENIGPDEVLGKDGLAQGIVGLGDLLRAYGCLTKIQKDLLCTNDGLDLGLLSPSQWEVASRLLQGKLRLKNVDPCDISLVAKREVKGEQFLYTFTVRSSGNVTPLADFALMRPKTKQSVQPRE